MEGMCRGSSTGFSLPQRHVDLLPVFEHDGSGAVGGENVETWIDPPPECQTKTSGGGIFPIWESAQLTTHCDERGHWPRHSTLMKFIWLSADDDGLLREGGVGDRQQGFWLRHSLAGHTVNTCLMPCWRTLWCPTWMALTEGRGAAPSTFELWCETFVGRGLQILILMPVRPLIPSACVIGIHHDIQCQTLRD